MPTPPPEGSYGFARTPGQRREDRLVYLVVALYLLAALVAAFVLLHFTVKYW